MVRQRLKTRSSPWRLLGHVLVFLLACALVFYGAILLLLALKVTPGSLDAVSGYRSAYDELASLQDGDIGDTLRLVAGVVGLVAFLVFATLAVKLLPRPYLARHDLELDSGERGVVTVEPRAIERVAESAARQHAAVADAAGRYGDDELSVNLTVRRARDAAQAMRDVQASVVGALEQHGLPVVPVHVVLTGYERRTHRELH